MAAHSFVAVDLVRVDARVVDTDGAEDVEYSAEAGSAQTEVMCEICHEPATVEVVRSECAGPKIPDYPHQIPS